MRKPVYSEDQEIGMAGPSATEDTIDALIVALRSENGVGRQEVRKRLVFIGKPAVDLLIPLLKDRIDVRWEAAKALSEIADPRATSELVATLQDHNFGVRWLAAEGLIAIGRDALIPLLEALIKRSDSVWLRGGAHHVLHDLAKMGQRDLVAPVLAALEGVDPEIEVQEPALKVLQQRIKPPS